MSKLTIYKDNNVINASYRLSLGEQRLILSCIGQINPTMDDLGVYSVSTDDYAKLFNLSRKRAYRELKDVAEQLFDRYVIIDAASLPDDLRIKYKVVVESGTFKTRWVSHLQYDNVNLSLSLCFSPLMIPYLSQLKSQFTKYDIEHVANFSSVYAIRIYEFLAQRQFQSTKSFVMPLMDLRDLLQLDDSKHRLYGHLKSRVLDPAINQINDFSNITADYTEKKRGKKVVSIQFNFEIKAGMTAARNSKQNPYKHTTEAEIKKLAKPGETIKQARERIIKSKSTVKAEANEPTSAETKKPKKPKSTAAGLKHISDIKTRLH